MAEPQTPTTLVDWLDDLTVRFLLNLPASELSSVPRLCFQVEEAQWFYEDFVRPAVAASGASPLPSLPLRRFCLMLFQHCPLLSGFTDAQHIAAYEEFLAYKVRVPVRGAILLDQNMEKVVLVRGWKKGASWSFPRGKINKDEKDLDCAVREVYEETGYDARQAGLVPENEDEAKYIDITMREQHMRLFVFRGVPEDTYFEPKTRKEISKIQWYPIRDLPGFKKQKQGQNNHENEAQHANKFYMVAPFLGLLKKWINQQRRYDAEKTKNAAAVGNGYGVQTATEDEGEVEEEQTSEPVAPVEDKSEELRRLLSIGVPMPAAPSVPEPARPDAHAGNLLAMLQGRPRPANGGRAPHTPFEQINAFPQQPETPQPDHLRHPSNSQQHQQPPPPQFPFSPPRPQPEQQRNISLPTPNIFGPPGFQPIQHPGFPGLQVPPHLQHAQFQQRQSIPGPLPVMPFGYQDGRMPFNGMPRPPMQPPQMPPPQMQQPPPPAAYMAQGPQGAIASGPAVPNASQLPPPRLNAHSMKLLDAFKSGGKPASCGSSTQAPHPGSTHQAALLDLFRKPAIAPTPSEAVPEPASPASTDVTVRPGKTQERRPTLNEITRTLPLKPKVKSPPVPEPATQSTAQAPVSELMTERPKSRQLFDPSNPVKFVRASKESPKTKQSPQSSHATMQPPPHKHASRSPKPKKASASQHQDNGRSTQNGPQPPPFTILARPGSAKGPQSPGLAAAAPPSPSRNESSKPPFKPQVLKRPKVSDSGSPNTLTADSKSRPNTGVDKKDQLLALFGKATANTTSAAPSQPAPTGLERKPSEPGDRKSTLLDLFNTSPKQPAPTQPPAPRIEPEKRPSSHAVHQTRQPQQQNLLLDLFNKSATGTPITSPGTPISPFTLGTPAEGYQSFEQRSRLGSVVSTTSNGDRTSTTTTPVEAKEFLMGYLNGVVRNEGHRGAGRR